MQPTITTTSRIPEGLMQGTEFFTVNDHGHRWPMTFKNRRLIKFEMTPKHDKEILRVAMKSQPMIEKAMESLAGRDEEKKLAQYVMCRYGELNGSADIDTKGVLSEPEYVLCPERGKCQFEGIGCVSIMVKDGIFLSKAETEVFKRVRLSDKQIAAELFLSVKTVNTHWQNIRFKTGLNTKIEIGIYAAQKGII